ncbi:hypothetical protein [Lewinella sp. IMCC34191]|uniref:hypothetical protein n=1 Tax=Lewinella sp. IMCC34191 TaxID=2259172 RepID=UPI0013009B35|nr:hypothetical protein [Lewinella sp. IMCC34191]
MRYLLTPLALLVLMLTSCSAPDPKTGEAVVATEAEETTPVAASAVEPTNGNVLCTINGEPWSYTEATAFTNTFKKTGDRYAYVTFENDRTEKPEKIQLHFNITKQEIEMAIVNLYPVVDGETKTAKYNWNPNKLTTQPENQVSGTLTPTEETLSGSADLDKLEIAAGSTLSGHSDYQRLSIRDIVFTDLPYEDHDEMMKGLQPGG